MARGFSQCWRWNIGRVVEQPNGQGVLNNMRDPNSNPSSISIENLCNQLGFQGNLKGFSDGLSAPLLNLKKQGALWGNRNALALGVHVDNWLAVVAGEQVAYMMNHLSSMKEGLLRNLTGDFDRKLQKIGGVREECIRLEKQRLIFQLSVVDPEFSYFDQSLTFMGYSMENLRSSLAMWVENNSSVQAASWHRSLILRENWRQKNLSFMRARTSKCA